MRISDWSSDVCSSDLVERYPTYGGTCLNVCCIPSKSLLDSSEHYHNLETNFKAHGIEASCVKLDFGLMIARKDEVVKQTTDGIAFLFKKNKIDAYEGHGSFVDKNTIRITGEKDKDQTIQTKRVIIATGSKPSSLPFLKIDTKRITIGRAHDRTPVTNPPLVCC